MSRNISIAAPSRVKIYFAAKISRQVNIIIFIIGHKAAIPEVTSST